MRIIDNPNESIKPAHLVPRQDKHLENENGNVSKRFSDADIELILKTLALNGGQMKKTSQQLREQFKLEVHPQTLKRWKDVNYHSAYSRLQRELSDELSTQLAGKITDVAHQSISIQERLQEEMDEQLNSESFELKELPSAIRNMAQASEISIRQKHLLEDKPTEILEVRGIEETISDLEESELIVDADVVDEEDIPDDDSSSSIALPI